MTEEEALDVRSLEARLDELIKQKHSILLGDRMLTLFYMDQYSYAHLIADLDSVRRRLNGRYDR